MGDIQATAGTIPPPPACGSGSWTPGPVIETLGAKISVEGKKVVLEAKCTFVWAGSPPPLGCKVSDTSTVTLSPGTTILTDDGSDILRNGDKAEDSYGNKLEAVVSQTKLKSA